MLVGFALVLSPETLVDNVHWGVAPTWSNLALAVPVAMLAYTGVETVSNLAEEVRDPVRSVPQAYKLVAGAVFAIFFTLPFVALSALPVERIDGELTTRLALPPEEGGFANDPMLGLVENLGLEGALLDAARDLRRRPRRDDPVHRDERGRDRRLPDHLLDGDLPAAAGGVPAPAPAVQDAVARARPLRRARPDRDPPAGRRQLRRHAVLVRRDASRSRSRTPRSSGCGCSPRRRRSGSAARGRTCASAGSTGRSSRSSAASRRRSRSSSSSSRTTRDRWTGLGWIVAGLIGYALYRRSRSGASPRATIKAPPAFGPALALQYRRLLVPVLSGQASDDALDIAASLAAERGAQIARRRRCSRSRSSCRSRSNYREEEAQANRELDEARAIGELLRRLSDPARSCAAERRRRDRRGGGAARHRDHRHRRAAQGPQPTQAGGLRAAPSTTCSRTLRAA